MQITFGGGARGGGVEVDDGRWGNKLKMKVQGKNEKGSKEKEKKEYKNGIKRLF